MNLKILYFYYTDNIDNPNIIDIIKEHEIYSKYYNKNEDESLELSKPLKIDEILDIYNERKKDFKDNIFLTDIYYLLVDLDNKEILKILVEKTQNDKKFKGWINPDSENYKKINDYFVKSGKFEKFFTDIQNKLKK